MCHAYRSLLSRRPPTRERMRFELARRSATKVSASEHEIERNKRTTAAERERRIGGERGEERERERGGLRGMLDAVSNWRLLTHN